MDDGQQHAPPGDDRLVCAAHGAGRQALGDLIYQLATARFIAEHADVLFREALSV